MKSNLAGCVRAAGIIQAGVCVCARVCVIRRTNRARCMWSSEPTWMRRNGRAGAAEGCALSVVRKIYYFLCLIQILPEQPGNLNNDKRRHVAPPLCGLWARDLCEQWQKKTARGSKTNATRPATTTTTEGRRRRQSGKQMCEAETPTENRKRNLHRQHDKQRRKATTPFTWHGC